MAHFGVLVISHGSRDPGWVRLVDEAVAAVRVRDGVPVVSAFLEIVEGRLIQDGIDELERLGVTDIAVVPLFVSAGSTHVDEIAYALGVQAEPRLETDLAPFAVRARVHMGSPIDDGPEAATILYEKLAELSTSPAQELVLLIGHGSKEPGFHEKWRGLLNGLAARLRGMGGFAEADGAMLLPDEAATVLTKWKAERPELRAIVAPVFLSEGYFTNRVIPERLSGLDYRYNGKAMLPHPLIARWIERQLDTFGLAATMSEHDAGG